MEPIINPWLMYAINVCNGIHAISLGIAIISGALFILSLIERLSQSMTTSKVANINKLEVLLFVMTIVFVILTILIPDKQTLTQMLIFNYITVDNVNMSKDYLVEFIKTVVQTVNDGNK